MKRLERRRNKHARQRLQERYSMPISDEELQALANLIAANKAVFLEASTLDRRIFLVPTSRNVQIPVVYSKRHRRILTVLPADDYRVTQAAATRSLSPEQAPEQATSSPSPDGVLGIPCLVEEE